MTKIKDLFDVTYGVVFSKERELNYLKDSRKEDKLGEKKNIYEDCHILNQKDIPMISLGIPKLNEIVFKNPYKHQLELEDLLFENRSPFRILEIKNNLIKDKKLITSSNFLILRKKIKGKDSKISNKLILYFLESDYVKNYISDIIKNKDKTNINKNELEEMEIPDIFLEKIRTFDNQISKIREIENRKIEIYREFNKLQNIESDLKSKLIKKLDRVLEGK